MTQEKKKWYDNKVITHLLLVFFFPVGLYALWKSDVYAKWWKITASVIIGLLFIANMMGGDKNSPSNENNTAVSKIENELTQEQKDSIAAIERLNLIEERKNNTISSARLVAAYKNNEVSADNNFKGKSFYVEGYIGDIGKDILDDAYITLKSDDILSTVQCYIEDQSKVANLSKGQKVTIWGKCEGLMMNVLMKDAELVSNIEDL